MVDESSEGSDEVGEWWLRSWYQGMFFKKSRLVVSELILGAPNLTSSFVDDGVLMGVALLFQETRRRSEDMREEGKVHLKVFFEVGKSWLYLGGCWRYRGLGAGRCGWGRDTRDGGGGGREREVFNGNAL